MYEYKKNLIEELEDTMEKYNKTKFVYDPEHELGLKETSIMLITHRTFLLRKIEEALEHLNGIGK